MILTQVNEGVKFISCGATHKGTPTPHVQYSYKNVNPMTGQTFLNKDRGPAAPITQQQIRLIRKFLEKQN